MMEWRNGKVVAGEIQ